MTFIERYEQEKTWHGRALVMEIYHLAMISRVKSWTVTKTAEHFNVSIGLASENLRLAQAIHDRPSILEVPSRQEALNKVRRTR